jgi:hypothetical protein
MQLITPTKRLATELMRLEHFLHHLGGVAAAAVLSVENVRPGDSTGQCQRLNYWTAEFGRVSGRRHCPAVTLLIPALLE